MSISRSLKLSLIAATTLGTLILTGCGIGTPAAASKDALGSSSLASFTGKAMGGDIPIVGAAVILWETDPATSGYGVTARNIEHTTTLANGLFTLPTGYSCTSSNDFLYITVTGGDVSNGGGIINNNEVQIAALGSCANFATTVAQAAAYVNVNEVSTVAAAYALGNFMSVHAGSSAGNQLVYIGSDANNSNATGSCSGTGASMTCTAAGLAHAFANALNLTNSVGTVTALPTGLANTTMSGNTLGSIPQAQIHALADILQTCTNSLGGVAGDSSVCGTLFTDATPSGGTAPTDELSAMLDIAKNPKHNVGTTCTAGVITGGLFCMVTSTPVFTPVLSAAPYDWTITVFYTGLSNQTGATSWGSPAATPYYPEWLALDANDNVYILSGNTNVYTTAVTSTMAEMNSVGVGQWANAPSIDGASGCYPGYVALDGNGNVWNTYAPPSSKTCTSNIMERPTTGGANTLNMTSVAPYVVQGQGNAIALDRYNNLWYARDTSSGTTMMEMYPYISTLSTATGHYNSGATSGNAYVYSYAGSTASGTLASVFGLFSDQYSNIYATEYSTTLSGNIWIIPNLTPASSSAPSYSTTVTAYPEIPLQGTTPTHSGAIGFDPNFYTNGIIYGAGDNGAWTRLTLTTAPSSSAALAVASSTASVCSAGCSVASITAQNSATTPSGATAPFNGMMDGAATFWYVNNTSSGSIWYSQTSTTATSFVSDSIEPCYAPAGATTCTAAATATAGPHNLAIDSTGALWITTETSGYVLQVIGPGSPIWPQLNYGIFGTKP